MTIVTKPLTDKKQETLKKPLVAAGGVTNGDVRVDVEADALYIIPSRAQHVSYTTILGLFVMALLVLGMGVVGGLYLYRQVGRTQPHRLKGWLQIPGVKDPIMEPERLVKFEDRQAIQNMMEEFEIDPLDDSEKIDVPDFGDGRRGRFIHDFNANKTGIIDMDAHRCFVMPLNRARVVPPKSMYDLLNKIWQGYYEVDTQIVRETYRVAFPRVTGVEEMGKFIYHECADLPTYRLTRVEDAMFKRSIPEMSIYTEFAGDKISEFHIIQDGISEYEKNNKLS